MTQTKDLERAKEQAQAQFESIRDMVERLKHAQECTDDDCTEGKDGGDTWDDADGYHDEENAQQTILEDALEIGVRPRFQSPSEKTEWGGGDYFILLCTGGPAARIVGTLNEHHEPDTAELECQDWFTPWTTHDVSDPDQVLLTYARQFYFGQ